MGDSLRVEPREQDGGRSLHSPPTLPTVPCPCSYGSSAPAGRPGLPRNGGQGPGSWWLRPSVTHTEQVTTEARGLCAWRLVTGKEAQARGEAKVQRIWECLRPGSSHAGSAPRKHNIPRREAASNCVNTEKGPLLQTEHHLWAGAVTV